MARMVWNSEIPDLGQRIMRRQPLGILATRRVACNWHSRTYGYSALRLEMYFRFMRYDFEVEEIDYHI